MKKGLTIFSICFFLISISSSLVYAVPYLQVYIPGATAGTIGEDEDTWFFTGLPGTINFKVVVNVKDKYDSVDYVTLLLTFPKTQSGTMTPTGFTHLTTAPGTGAVVDFNNLTNVAWNDAYQTTGFLPSGAGNNHYPLNKVGFNYIIFNLGAFDVTQSATLNDYDADTGTIGSGSGYGEERIFSINITGFNYVHFDVYAQFIEGANTSIETTWEINPGSHDSSTTPVPEPATMLLLGSGLIGLAGVARRRFKR